MGAFPSPYMGLRVRTIRSRPRLQEHVAAAWGWCEAAHSDGDQKSQERLVRKLQDQRYLAVLDDVWSTDTLNKLVSALILPRLAGAVSGSRVVITTRNESVAAAGRSHFILHLGPLPMDESWTLFCQSAFPDRNGECPPGLLHIAPSIVEHCGGLPAAIKVYGSCLRRREREMPLSGSASTGPLNQRATPTMG